MASDFTKRAQTVRLIHFFWSHKPKLVAWTRPSGHMVVAEPGQEFRFKGIARHFRTYAYSLSTLLLDCAFMEGNLLFLGQAA